jgi:hypothetical protein
MSNTGNVFIDGLATYGWLEYGGDRHITDDFDNSGARPWSAAAIAQYEAALGFNPGSSWNAKAAADYNGDGRSDILWQNDNGAPGLWLMDGFAVIADAGVGFNPGPTWKVIDHSTLI